MSKLDKNRPRLLVVSESPSIRNDLVTLLTGYGYYVDYVNDRRDGLRKYRQHKHAVVIFDVGSLPRYPVRLFRLFMAYHHNPTIMIAATSPEEPGVYKYLDKGVYDIVQLPLRMDYVHFVLRRMVEHNAIISQTFFYRMMLVVTLLFLPVWLLLVYLMSLYWWS